MPQLITDGSKILSKCVENLPSLFIKFFAHRLKEHAQDIRLHMQEGVLPHFFNTAEILEYVGS